MKRKVGLLLLVLVFLAGCASMGMKPLTEMTAKEKSYFFVSTYNKHFDRTLKLATTPGLTDAQKTMVRSSKEVLTKVYPLIKAYVFIVETGGIPSPQDEDAILDMLDKLILMGGNL